VGILAVVTGGTVADVSVSRREGTRCAWAGGA
jgi:hypothetical protein